MPQGAGERLRDVLAPVVTGSGLDLEAVEVSQAGRRSVVRVLVDKDGGVTLDDVAVVSRAVSEALDALEVTDPTVLAGAYVLEVGSPGVDRPLTAPRHWRRNVGRLVRVTRMSAVGGGEVTGRIRSASEAAVTLHELGDALDGEGELVVAYEDVQRALVQVEFNRGDAREGAEDEIDELDGEDA